MECVRSLRVARIFRTCRADQLTKRTFGWWSAKTTLDALEFFLITYRDLWHVVYRYSGTSTLIESTGRVWQPDRVRRAPVPRYNTRGATKSWLLLALSSFWKRDKNNSYKQWCYSMSCGRNRSHEKLYKTTCCFVQLRRNPFWKDFQLKRLAKFLHTDVTERGGFDTHGSLSLQQKKEKVVLGPESPNMHITKLRAVCSFFSFLASCVQTACVSPRA